MTAGKMTVTFGGRDVSVALAQDCSLRQLGQLLESTAHVQADTIKLLLPGHKGGPIKLSGSPDKTLSAAGETSFLTFYSCMQSLVSVSVA